MSGTIIRTSLDKALEITASFEGGAGYSNLAGDFDGMGMSYGLFQWNAGKGTLQPILRKCLQGMPKTVEEIFTPEGFAILEDALETDPKFLRWTKSINDPKHRIIEPWRTRFLKLGETGGYQRFQREAAKSYIDTARMMMRVYGFHSERALALCFDIAIQNGSVIQSARTQYNAALRPGMDEKTKLKLLAEAVASTARPQYQADVRSRKMTIVNGRGMVHGKMRTLDLKDSPASYPEG